jgi:hypothetical protein
VGLLLLLRSGQIQIQSPEPQENHHCPPLLSSVAWSVAPPEMVGWGTARQSLRPPPWQRLQWLR